MTDQKPHIPSTETAESCFLDGAAGEFLPGDWHAFLAQVKRDAAREALDGLAHHTERMSAQDRERRMLLSADREQHVTRRAVKYRDTHYPETED